MKGASSIGITSDVNFMYLFTESGQLAPWTISPRPQTTRPWSSDNSPPTFSWLPIWKHLYFYSHKVIISWKKVCFLKLFSLFSSPSRQTLKKTYLFLSRFKIELRCCSDFQQPWVSWAHIFPPFFLHHPIHDLENVEFDSDGSIPWS